MGGRCSLRLLSSSLVDASDSMGARCVPLLTKALLVTLTIVGVLELCNWHCSGTPGQGAEVEREAWTTSRR